MTTVLYGKEFFDDHENLGGFDKLDNILGDVSGAQKESFYEGKKPGDEKSRDTFSLRLFKSKYPPPPSRDRISLKVIKRYAKVENKSSKREDIGKEMRGGMWLSNRNIFLSFVIILVTVPSIVVFHVILFHVISTVIRILASVIFIIVLHTYRPNIFLAVKLFSG